MAGDMDENGREPIDIVTTVGPLDPVVATLRDVLHRSGALRVVVVVDTEEPAIIDVGQLLPIEVQIGDRVMHLPHAIELDAEPLGLIEARQLPPFEVDPDTGEVAGMIGGLHYLADVARGLAGLLGGRSVAMIQVRTTTPELPLAVTARIGEPVVVAIGEEEYELPEEGGPEPSGA
jgi:hypothetical protein